MNNFKKFPSIEQFRSVCKQVQATCKYHEIDKPTITFTGSVKIHGTNAGVGYDPETGDIWAQKRSGICTPSKDNMGFAAFVEMNKDAFISFFKENVDSDNLHYIFGEWYGPGIQKGVGVSELSKKRFTIFSFYEDHEDTYTPRSHSPRAFESDQIDYIGNYQMWAMDVDFNSPELFVNDMIKITESVEAECPVALKHGIKEGVGEGIVWTGMWRGQELKFKVKGEKHSVTKVKKLASVDVEKLASIREFVEYAVTPNRLEQGIAEVFTSNGLEPDIRKMGDYIRWVNDDVFKEEMDTLKENGLERKDYGRELSDVARRYFMEKYR